MTPIAASPALALATALAFVRREEGGYNGADPSDPGGATSMGITRATLAGWRRVAPSAITAADVQALTWDEAAAIYTRDYWPASGGAVCAEYGRSRLALVTMDWGVNGGQARATRYLQAALNAAAPAGIAPLVVDGQLGAKSRAALAALSDVEEIAAVETYLALRWAHYQIRACVEPTTQRAALVAAGIDARFIPQPDEHAGRWLLVWRNRLRRCAIACGLAPYPSTA